MGRRGRKKGFNPNLNRIFNNFKGAGKRQGPSFNGIRWFTPTRCCVCGAICTMLIISGVGFYSIIIVALLIVILEMCDRC